MQFRPKTNTYKTKVQDSFNRQAFMEFIGAQLLEVKPGYCKIEIPYRNSLTQQHGFFHAGIVSTLADNAAGYAAFSLMDEDSSVLTVEFKLNLLSPGKGDKLIAEATVLKNGKTLTICRSEVFAVQGEKQTLCAAGQSTLIELKNKTDAPPPT